MSIRFYLLIFCILTLSFECFSQTKVAVDSIRTVINKVINEGIVHDKIKDSTAIYTLTVLIDVTLEGKQQFVDVSVNNPKFSSGLDLDGLNKLKKIDFRLLMNDKKNAKFSFKIYFAVFDSKYNHAVKLEDVTKSLQNLILKDEFEIHNLGFKVIVFDKTVYH